MRHPLPYAGLVTVAGLAAGYALFKDWRGVVPLALAAGFITYRLWKPGGALARSSAQAIDAQRSDES
jgi:hypothetical protein